MKVNVHAFAYPWSISQALSLWYFNCCCRSPVGRRPFRGPIGPRRSPPRRFVRSFQRPLERRPRHSPEKEKPAAQPVIVPTGPKIISTKKEKKEEEKKEETEKKETEEEKKEGKNAL